MKQRLVDFSDPILSAVLFILLKDRTTGKNIIWATEPPPELGAGFSDEITLEQIKEFPPVPRVLKRLDEQKQRTKAKAEVFTPSWVCEKMIDMGEENGAMPDMKKEPIKYIHSTVLEITCGEAPFLVNLYDTVTGKKIPVPRRKGLFDRKLKCVNNWFDWNVWTWHDVAEDAATTTYGYEWQGDSLLLARANMLLTWRENFKWLFGIEPDAWKVRNMAAIISWNIWQMDGLKKTVPGTNILCKIKDWKADKEILFKDVGEEKMRLVDADKLTCFLEGYKSAPIVTRKENPISVERVIEIFCNYVKAACTINQETMRPIAHLNIYPNDDDMDKTCYCSNCNEHFPEDWLYPGWEHGNTKLKPIKYCPYCGAEFENKI